MRARIELALAMLKSNMLKTVMMFCTVNALEAATVAP